MPRVRLLLVFITHAFFSKLYFAERHKNKNTVEGGSVDDDTATPPSGVVRMMNFKLVFVCEKVAAAAPP